MQFWIEEYISQGIQFSPAWFEHYIDDKMLRSECEKVKKFSIDIKDKIQIIGLGSVLISTVAFAAAFTLPGGYSTDNGTPVLGRNYVFKAFILADVLAFALAFLSTASLIFCCISRHDQDRIENEIKSTVHMFTVAAKCLAMAMALGLYVVLSPISKGIGIVTFAVAGFVLFLDPFVYISRHVVRVDQKTIVFWRKLRCNVPFFNRNKTTILPDDEFPRGHDGSFEFSLAMLKLYVRIIIPLAFIFFFAMLK
jgi:Domain of unknown function